VSLSPYRLVSQLALDPELAVLSALDVTLKQAACALLAAHQDIGRAESEAPVTSAARAVIECAWNLRGLLRRYRAMLARNRRSRDIPF
jgi:hypothetical protein